MRIAIFGRITDNTELNVLVHFFDYLEEVGIQYSLYKPYAEALQKYLPAHKALKKAEIFDTQEEVESAKFLFCFGGDGTVLEAVRFCGQLGKPILGVNFGRMGYLTSISQHELIPTTEELMKDMYRIDKRSLLSVISDPPGIFKDNPYGINDLSILKSYSNEMITVHTYINGEFLNSYWGDGLIVATPTGSTAYSLSCGGPIIFPSSSAFVITPVASHSLTVRPVVIPEDWVVSFEIESRSKGAMVALDTRTELVEAGTAIAVRKANFKVKLIKLPGSKHVDNLRRSLMWGSDVRN